MGNPIKYDRTEEQATAGETLRTIENELNQVLGEAHTFLDRENPNKSAIVRARKALMKIKKLAHESRSQLSAIKK